MAKTFWGILLLQEAMLAVVCFTLGLTMVKYEQVRGNAMDVCAWHARSIFDDDPNGIQQRWRSVAKGELVCPFCGQLHDRNWVSRSGWDSQINAMEAEEGREQ